MLLAHASRRHTPWRITGNITRTALQKRNVTIQQLDAQRNSRERIVILGSGWAGYTLARDLDSKKYQVVVVSPRSYFVFTPLLASTSVGTLEFRTALEPIRTRGARGQFFQGWADAVDFDSKKLTIEEAVEDPLQGQSLSSDRHADESNAQRAEDRKAEVAKGQLFDMTWDKMVIAVGCYVRTFMGKSHLKALHSTLISHRTKLSIRKVSRRTPTS